MVRQITSSQIEFLIPSQPLPFKGIQENGNLKEKISRLRQRMSYARQETDLILKDNQKINQTIAIISKDQAEMEMTRKVIKKEQENMDKNTLIIKQEQNSMRLSFNHMMLKWKDIFRQCIDLQKEQQAVRIALNKVELKGKDIHQTARSIRLNVEMIIKNLNNAKQSAGNIQQIALVIQQNQTVIQGRVNEIVQKRDYMQQRIHLIDLVLKNLKETVDFDLPDIAGIGVSENDGVLAGLGKLLLKKIIEFSSWIIKGLGAVFAHARTIVKNWFTDYRWSIITQAITHPATWMALGILACTVRKNIKLSLFCICIQGSLSYLQRNPNFYKIGD
jgi:hypothetical protein